LQVARSGAEASAEDDEASTTVISTSDDDPASRVLVGGVDSS
jgi:hypothetical protein